MHSCLSQGGFKPQTVIKVFFNERLSFHIKILRLLPVLSFEQAFVVVINQHKAQPLFDSRFSLNRPLLL